MIQNLKTRLNESDRSGTMDLGEWSWKTIWTASGPNLWSLELAMEIEDDGDKDHVWACGGTCWRLLVQALRLQHVNLFGNKV